MATLAAIAARRVENSPKTAEPLPDMAASAAPARLSAVTSRAISGCFLTTTGWRSLRECRGPWASHHAKAFFVLTPNEGMTRTTHARGASMSGNSTSPRPKPSTVPPSKKYGTSAPSDGAIARTRATSTRHSRPSARRAAAASLLGQTNRQIARSAAAAGGLPQVRGGAPDQVGVVGRAARIVAREPKTPANAADCERVVQRDRLKDGPQLVKAIGSQAEHVQRSVDFRERANARQRPSAHGPSARSTTPSASSPRR
jgi:hypothetical protein